VQAWRVVRYGPPEQALSLQDIPDPAPGAGQTLVKVRSTSLNYNEVDGCYGRYRTVDPPVPYTLGMEVLGDVVAAGEGAEHWVGRRVIASATGAFGAHAQLVVVEADMTFDAPPSLDDHAGAAFFFPFHVAHLALVERGHLQAGQTLLVHAGAGGVGSAAVQLGAALGARVIATAGSEEKLEFCRMRGADLAINYRTEDVAQVVLDATGGRGVDVVCDLVGGETTLATFPAVAHGGRHVLAGFSGGIEEEDVGGLTPRGIVFGNIDVCGALLSYRSEGKPRYPGVHPFPRSAGEAVQTHLVQLLEAGKISPVVGRVASYRDLPAELQRMSERATVGRTILDWSQD
jgi:NADPH:quinone reductase-like Zn-dependent oxidoreductase